jgi:hypothetical protein
MATSLVRFPSAHILCTGSQCESARAIHHVVHPFALIHAHVLHVNWGSGWREVGTCCHHGRHELHSQSLAGCYSNAAWNDEGRTACHLHSCHRMTHLRAPDEPESVCVCRGRKCGKCSGATWFTFGIGRLVMMYALGINLEI